MEQLFVAARRKRMRRFIGLALMIIGTVHILYFSVIYRDRYAAIAREGVFNTIDGDDKREAAFWTIWVGVLLLTVGSLIRSIQSLGDSVPAFPGWTLLGTGLVGGVVMPASPFWLAIPLGLAILRRSPSAEAAEARPTSPATGRAAG